MHRKTLKVFHFQASLVSLFFPVMTVWCLTGGAVGIAAAADDTLPVPDSSWNAVDSVDATGSSTGATVSTDSAAPGGNDGGYVFTEEYRDEDTVDTTAGESGTVPSSEKRMHSPDPGRRFLSLVTVAQLLAKKYSRLFAGPLAFAKKHTGKLGVLAVSLLIILLTVSFYRERRERGRFMTTTRLSVMDKEVQRACRYIEEHFDEPDLSIDRICSALVTGEAFLEALFVKELGLAVEDFIVQVRINRARILLRNSAEISSATLAVQCGFSDEKRFLERFSAITGCSPEEYRRRLPERTDAPA